MVMVEEEEGEDKVSWKSFVDGFVSIFVPGLITVCFEIMNLHGFWKVAVEREWMREGKK